MKRKQRVAIIGTVGIPAKYGGFETLAHNMAERLQDAYNLTVYCSSKAYTDRPEKYGNVRLKYVPLKANGWQSIFYDMYSMLSALRANDVLLVLGVSGALIIPVIKVFSSARIIIHIDGLEWKRDKWGKYVKQFLKYSEKIAVRSGNVVIADNEVLQDYVRLEYGKDSVLIEYGADHIIDIKSPVQERYAFSVCRIEPENNVHLILEAFSKMPDHELKFVGNWKLSEYSKLLWEKYSSFKNITLLDPVYDPHQLANLRNNANLYLHGHSAGGTNPSLVEAMYSNLPIVAFDVPYNRCTTENQAVYFSAVDELMEKVTSFSQIEKERMAGALRAIASRRYRWDVIAEKYSRLF